MAEDRHVRSEDYVETREGLLPGGTLALMIHDHLLAVCSTCAKFWSQLASGKEALRQLLDQAGTEAAAPAAAPSGDLSATVPEDVPDHHLSCISPQVRRDDEILRRLRRIRTRARLEVWRLVRIRPEYREETVRRAFSQYRSRATAEFLVERCRALIHSDPAEAGDLAALVPWVLRGIPDAAESSWSVDLAALARGWRANALRVAGDLPAADLAFAELRRDLAKTPALSNEALAELYGLEASLRLHQRREGEAEELLDLAQLLYRSACREDRLVRTLLRQGDLLAAGRRPAEALPCYAAAALRLEEDPSSPELPPGLAVSAVAGQVAALCELERHPEAKALLADQVDVFEEGDALHTGALLRGLQGRIAMGEGDLDEARECFRASRDGYLAADRRPEAALATLDLAELYLRAQRPAELRSLARQLLPLLRDLDVPRETLAPLLALVEGPAAEGLSPDALHRLRRAVAPPEDPSLL